MFAEKNLAKYKEQEEPEADETIENEGIVSEQVEMAGEKVEIVEEHFELDGVDNLDDETEAADLFDFEDHGIQITVHKDFLHQLGIAGFFPFFPEFLAGAGPVGGFAALQGFIPGLFIDISQHQHFIGFPILGDGGNQSIRFFEIKFDHFFSVG